MAPAGVEETSLRPGHREERILPEQVIASMPPPDNSWRNRLKSVGDTIRPQGGKKRRWFKAHARQGAGHVREQAEWVRDTARGVLDAQALAADLAETKKDLETAMRDLDRNEDRMDAMRASHRHEVADHLAEIRSLSVRALAAELRAEILDQALSRGVTGIVEFSFGPQYLTYQGLYERLREAAVGAIVELVSGFSVGVPSTTPADPEERLRRDDGAIAWSASLEVGDGRPAKLTWWVLCDGTIELAAVGPPDDCPPA